MGAVVVSGIVLGGILGIWLRWGMDNFRPSVAVNTVVAVASEVPVFVEIPTLTPSLTPSVTPTPTNTPTSTPTPSMTPTPTLTPTPTPTPTDTPTPTPTETPTRVWPTWTPKPRNTATPIPTPVPTAVPPTLVEPEDRAPFREEKAIIKLVWTSSHVLKPDECYLVVLHWIEEDAPASTQVCIQETFWYVDQALYLRADQTTDRVYYWSVRLVQKETDEEGNESFVPFSPSSEEWTFHWR